MNFFTKLKLIYMIGCDVFAISHRSGVLGMSYRLDGYWTEDQLHVINTILHRAGEEIYNNPVWKASSKEEEK